MTMPTGVCVSFQKNTTESDEVVCSSFLRRKSKSRLSDSVDDDCLRVKNSPCSSNFDPVFEEDFPNDFKKMKIGAPSATQSVSLILIFATLVCTLTVNFCKNRKFCGLDLWRWEVVVLLLINGRLVSGLVIRILVFYIGRNVVLRKRVLYFIYIMRNAMHNCVWLALILIAWQCLIHKKGEKETRIFPYVTKIWVCLLVGTLIWLSKTLLVKVLASFFQVSAFFDKIHEALFNQYVIETLSGLPLLLRDETKVTGEVELKNKRPTMLTSLADKISGSVNEILRKGSLSTSSRSPISKIEDQDDITVAHLHRLNQKNVSAWNMERLINKVREGVILNLDERKHGSTDENESMVQITSERHADNVAKHIFQIVARPRARYIYLDDLMRFWREGEAVKVMHLLEGACEHKGISKRQLKTWAVNAFRDRITLVLSLNDAINVVNSLHQMMKVLAGAVIIISWLLIFRVLTTQFFMLIGSEILLAVLFFGDKCKQMLEAIIFIFVMHPFDVGDRVEVDGLQMLVEEITLLTTVFREHDNHKVYYSNSVLSTKIISNYYRSPDVRDSIDFCTHIFTPMMKLERMKNRIIRYVNDWRDHWCPQPLIVMREIEDMNTLKWSLSLYHKMNHQDVGERWARRNRLIEEMVRIFKELDIQFSLEPCEHGNG